MKKKFLESEIRRTKGELVDGIENLVGEKRFQAWKKFAFKGEMIQLAVAFVLGASFQKVVTGLSNYCIMPILNWVLSFTGTNWREHTYEITDGLILETGNLAGTFVDFLLISIILFFVYRRLTMVFKEDELPKEKLIICLETMPCAACREHIHYLCERCPHCTSWVVDIDNNTTRRTHGKTRSDYS